MYWLRSRQKKIYAVIEKYLIKKCVLLLFCYDNRLILCRLLVMMVVKNICECCNEYFVHCLILGFLELQDRTLMTSTKSQALRIV